MHVIGCVATAHLIFIGFLTAAENTIAPGPTALSTHPLFVALSQANVQYLVSPDGQHLACALLTDGKWQVALDGKLGEPFESFCEIPKKGRTLGPMPAAWAFNHNGTHFAYAIRNGRDHHVVLDGKIGPAYEAIQIVGEGFLNFAPDHGSVAYVATKSGIQGWAIDGGPSPNFCSFDAKHAVATRSGSIPVIEDAHGVPIARIQTTFLRGGGGLALTADHRQSVYLTKRQPVSAIASRDNVYDVIADGKAIGACSDPSALSFSANGLHFGCIVSEEPLASRINWHGEAPPAIAASVNSHVMVDGKDMGYTTDNLCTLMISPDGRRWAGLRTPKAIKRADTGATGTLIVDGKEVISSARIVMGSFSFSPDSRHYWCVSEHKKHPNERERQVLVIHDGKELGPYDGVLVAPYDRMIEGHFGRREGWTIKDMTDPEYSPDGTRVAFRAYIKDKGVVLVIDGEPSKAYFAIGRPVFSPDSRHVAFVAQNEKGRRFVVADDKEGTLFDSVSLMANAFNLDGTRFWYLGRIGKTSFADASSELVENHGSIQESEKVRRGNVGYTADGRHLVILDGDLVRIGATKHNLPGTLVLPSYERDGNEPIIPVFDARQIELIVRLPSPKMPVLSPRSVYRESFAKVTIPVGS